MGSYSSFKISKRLKIIFSFFCIIFIQSCSDSQFGKRLSESFESPLKLDSNKQKLNQKQTKNLSLSQGKIKSLESKPKTISSESKPKTDSLKSKKALYPIKKKNIRTPSLRKKQLNSSRNRPYRIIIRILETNPSAPAETVTSLLRNAGVIFEVEKIERLEQDSSRKNSSLGK